MRAAQVVAEQKALGYDFIKTDAHLLQGLASLLYTYSDFTDDGTDTYLSGKAAGNYAWQITEAARFRQLLDYQVSFDDSDVYFINSEIRSERAENRLMKIIETRLLGEAASL